MLVIFYAEKFQGIQTMDPEELERILKGTSVGTSPMHKEIGIQANKPTPKKSEFSVQVR